MFGIGSQELLIEITREVHEGGQEGDWDGTRGGANTQSATRRSDDPGAAAGVRILQESPCGRLGPLSALRDAGRAGANSDGAEVALNHAVADAPEAPPVCVEGNSATWGLITAQSTGRG